MADTLTTQTTTLATIPGASVIATKEIASAHHQQVVVGMLDALSVTLTRPATTSPAYSVDDLLANSTTAGSVTPLTFSNVARLSTLGALLTRMRVYSPTTTNLGGVGLRVYLFTAQPTVTNGDNGAFSVATNLSTCIGSFDVTLEAITTGGAFGVGAPTNGPFLTLDPGTTTVYGLVRVLTAFTPASSGQFTFTLEALQD